MAIRVIGAGLGRTGTMSLKGALEAIGFDRCYHMMELFQNPEGVESWNTASRGEPLEWDQLFQGYQAIVDYPGCMYYKQLMEYYPDAKVILTTRDPDSWYESALSTIYPASAPNPSAPPPPPPIMPILQLIGRDIWAGHFQGRFEDREFALDLFRRHNEEVMSFVPADKLLVFEVKEGWVPLCKFLDVPVPHDKPFPHVNSREDFGRTVDGMLDAEASAS